MMALVQQQKSNNQVPGAQYADKSMYMARQYCTTDHKCTGLVVVLLMDGRGGELNASINVTWN